MRWNGAAGVEAKTKSRNLPEIRPDMTAIPFAPTHYMGYYMRYPYKT